MVSVCLPSDALSQRLPSYLGFSYLGRGVSLHGCSSEEQPLLLPLDEGYLLTASSPDLHREVAPLGPPAPVQCFVIAYPKRIGFAISTGEKKIHFQQISLEPKEYHGHLVPTSHLSVL